MGGLQRLFCFFPFINILLKKRVNFSLVGYFLLG